MNVQGRPMRTIWLGRDGHTVEIIDQTRLPHELVIIGLRTVEDAARAISTMQVRGAPLIGATAAYGVALGISEDPSDRGLDLAISRLAATRPTAVNLRWALAEMKRALIETRESHRLAAALGRAGEIAEADVAINRAIGDSHSALHWISEIQYQAASDILRSLLHRGDRHMLRNGLSGKGCQPRSSVADPYR